MVYRTPARRSVSDTCEAPMSPGDARGRAALTLGPASCSACSPSRLAIVRFLLPPPKSVRAAIRRAGAMTRARHGVRALTERGGGGQHSRLIGHAGKVGQQNPGVKPRLQKMQNSAAFIANSAKKVYFRGTCPAVSARLNGHPAIPCRPAPREMAKKQRARTAGSLL